MTLTKKITAVLTLSLLAAGSAFAFPLIGKKKTDQAEVRKLTPEQSALVDKAIQREALVLKTLKERSPLVETYIQNMKPDPIMGQVPDQDVHFLARVNFGKVIGETGYKAGGKDDSGGKFGFFKHSLEYITGLSKSLHLVYNDSGFVRMIVIDSNPGGFSRQNYTFSFIRNDFLGTVRTTVFDVQPVKGKAGQFFGRIWVERQGGNIVRFNGDLAGSVEGQAENYHFDSWRTNVQEGLWLPTSSYVEETDPKSPTHSLKLKAVNNIWGYQLKVPAKEQEATDIEVQDATDQSQQANDVSPLGAQREWIQQAEDNVIERLFTAGLIDAPSEFDKTLEALANNILAYNNIATTRPIRVRTLLTEQLESLSVGNTILLSKGLIDTTAIPSETGAQQMGNLNALLAFQVAHIVLGHRIDTKYAFSDRLLFPAESAFQKLPMRHIDQDNAEAAKKAIELMQVKELADSQQWIGLYLQQLAARTKGLKALTDPQLGDGLYNAQGQFYLQALVGKAPKLNDKDIKQQAAMPLASELRFEPWTDRVIQLHTTYEPLLSSRDKMPFEVTPVYYKLSYWKPDAPPAAAPAATPAATPTTGAAAPADGTTTAAQPAPASPAPTTNQPPQE